MKPCTSVMRISNPDVCAVLCNRMVIFVFWHCVFCNLWVMLLGMFSLWCNCLKFRRKGCKGCKRCVNGRRITSPFVLLPCYVGNGRTVGIYIYIYTSVHLVLSTTYWPYVFCILYSVFWVLCFVYLFCFLCLCLYLAFNNMLHAT